jgi:membrane protein DedA with SNARE-associated domain
VLASFSGQVTHWIAHAGVYAVFVLMACDALLPVGGELIMLYAGVVAAGAIAGESASLFGLHLSPGVESYVVLALSGALGYLAGSIVGWVIGKRGGRALVERRGHLFHLSEDRFARAEQWFDRRGRAAVFLGRLTPLVRSFISIPAGVFRSPFPSYVVLTLLGSLIWCFGFAAAGWALGSNWESFHSSFRYVDYAAVAAVAVAAVLLVLRHRSPHGRNAARVGDTAEH